MQTIILQKNLPIELDSHDIRMALKRLNYKERLEILMEYADQLLSNIFKTDEITPLTIEEYNRKLEESEEDVIAGRVYSHNEAVEHFEKWKAARN